MESFSGISLSKLGDDNTGEIGEVSKRDIAIIGMACRFGAAKNPDQFWANLKKGADFIKELPNNRRQDTNDLLRRLYSSFSEYEYRENAFLEDIDQFDNHFFNVSPKEASLMDPNQRLFLETAWEAIEDAGYGGKKLNGTRTGVYVGFSTDFGQEYKFLIYMLAPLEAGLSVPGNIKSIIASRISYLLNLNGPSMLVDTACSSSLVAVHLACQAIRNGECEQALAGGVKITLLPMKFDPQKGIGIDSADGRTRTFDDSSTGTGGGEGVAAILLKPLNKALANRDHILAIIKGSAVNQDGNSIGITAPNSKAQSEVIIKAWNEARLDPETITYIEAHGTGTRLGDPVEINGIQRAFQEYTAKKQFCAVGSVKTNIGHLDHAAGIAGLVKAVLALKHRQIPPSLYFQKPNRNIGFEESPVYVNDRLSNWETKGVPLRCGISSFGLSGTNCHLILEEAPTQDEKQQPINRGPQIFTLSAKSKEALARLVEGYRAFLENVATVDLEDLCYTANTGRGHYDYRLAMILRDKEELQEKLEKLSTFSGDLMSDPDLLMRRITNSDQKEFLPVETVEEAVKRELTTMANDQIKKWFGSDQSASLAILNEICHLYIKGADPGWEDFYQGRSCRRIILPVYPFERKKCWLKPDGGPGNFNGFFNNKESIHPLLDSCLESSDRETFSTGFAVERHWVLNEHKVNGKYVVPGTTFLEMIRAGLTRRFPSQGLEFQEIIFIAPLVVTDGVPRPVQTVVKTEGNFFEIVISSKTEPDGQWVDHVQGKVILRINETNPSKYEIDRIKSQLLEIGNIRYGSLSAGGVETGPRWNNLKKVLIGEDWVWAYLELPDQYRNDLREYGLHPSMLDTAVNIGIRSAGEGLYLPFSYKRFLFSGVMPPKFYSYLRKKSGNNANKEIVAFDVTLVDESGSVFAEIEDYLIKKVPERELKIGELAGEGSFYHEIGWFPQKLEARPKKTNVGPFLIFKDDQGLSDRMITQLKFGGEEVIEVAFGKSYQRLNNNFYEIEGNAEDYLRLLNDLKTTGSLRILHLLTLSGANEVNDLDRLEERQKKGIFSLFYLVKALARQRFTEKISFYLIADYANEVTKEEVKLNPLNAAFFGLGKVVAQEYENWKVRCIDIDAGVTTDEVILELADETAVFQSAYRKGTRYLPEFRETNLEKAETSEFKLKEEGVYIITGGTGGIGLEIGKYFASLGKAHLCLLGRSELPEWNQWDHGLGQKSTQKLTKIYQAIEEMKTAGAEVTYYSVNISDSAKLRTVLTELRKKYHKINGIIHGAGVAGEGILMGKDETVFRKVIAPKITGTWLLDFFTQQDNLDFFVMFSSITAVIGGPGMGDYTAGNSYLDLFAAYREKQGKRTISINWPAWLETGMAVDFGIDKAESLFHAISPKQALFAFHEILQKKISRMIIGKLNYNLEIADRLEQFPIKLSEAIKMRFLRAKKRARADQMPQQSSISDFVLTGREGADYTETEKQVASIWAEVLGITELNIKDNFYKLGGDSIQSLKIANLINKRLAGKVDISDIFQNLTIKELAIFLDQKTTGKVPPSAETYSNSDGQGLEIAYHMSHTQERIWFLQKLTPQLVAYNIPVRYHINYSIDLTFLKKAFRKLCDRHDALRIVVKEENGLPKQVVLNQVDPQIELVDITGFENPTRLLEELISQDHQKVFVLAEQLWRVKLYKLEEVSYCLYMSIHHLIVDGWSIRILIQDLLKIYHAYVQGTEPNLEPVQLKYVEFIQEQKKWLETAEFQKMEEYWLAELAGSLPKLNLPIDYQRPLVQTFHGSFLKLKISRAQTENLKELSKQLNSTLHMLFFTVYFLLLHRLTQDKEIIVGTPFLGRDDPELEKVVGLLINTICIRVNFDQVHTFRELFQQVREKILLAYKNGKYPYDLLVFKLNPDRDLSRNPVFETMFQFFENIPQENDGVSQFEFSLLCKEVTEGIEIRLEYNIDILRRETIEWFGKYFLNLLQQVGENHHRQLTDFEVLSKDDKSWIITEFSNTSALKFSVPTVSELFERTAALNPNAAALICEKNELTYGQLNEKSNQLASLLRKNVTRPNQPVGIMIKRGINLIIGILGVLKAGGVYVPVDPQYPADRINYIFSHSGTEILVTEKNLYEKTIPSTERENTVKTIIDLSEDPPEKTPGSIRIFTVTDLDCQPVGNLPAKSGGDLMYLIYTSGSTGRPKGVMVSHANALNYLDWAIKEFNLKAGDRMALVTSVSFDISVFEIFGALLSGACLCIVTDDQLLDGNLLLNYLEEKKVNIWHSVPVLIAQILMALETRPDRENLGILNRLRLALIGGEAWNVELAKEIRKFFRQARLYNMYGPTETTIWVSYYEIGEELAALSSLPIGKPIANNQILILDPSQKLCGIGIPGEIYISGMNVTRGYYQDEEKTREVFLTGSEPGSIIYKTGDRGRYLVNGYVEFLGRKDGLVKVRGYRIEVGEIENVILAGEFATEVAVVPRKEGESNYLICYYRSSQNQTPEQLRDYLREKLPDYMIPALFCKLEAMPLTPNGKIDRKQLAAREIDLRPRLENEYIEPESEIEKYLVGIWQELLPVKLIGIHDNFFALGGNSFLVSRMHAEIEHQYPQEIRIVDIFTYPTIAKLARRIMLKADAGGQSAKNLDQELEDLFTGIKKGEFTADQAARKLKNWEV